MMRAGAVARYVIYSLLVAFVGFGSFAFLPLAAANAAPASQAATTLAAPVASAVTLGAPANPQCGEHRDFEGGGRPTYKYDDPNCWFDAGPPPSSPDCYDGTWFLHSDPTCEAWYKKLPPDVKAPAQTCGPDEELIGGTTTKCCPKAPGVARDACIGQVTTPDPTVPTTQPARTPAVQQACDELETALIALYGPDHYLDTTYGNLFYSAGCQWSPENPDRGPRPPDTDQGLCGAYKNIYAVVTNNSDPINQQLANEGYGPLLGAGEPAGPNIGTTEERAAAVAAALRGPLQSHNCLAAASNDGNGQTCSQELTNGICLANVQSLTNGLAWYALAACVVGILVSASLWAMGAKGQSPGQELTGKRGLILCCTAALVVGAAPTLVNYLNQAADNMDKGDQLPSGPGVQSGPAPTEGGSNLGGGGGGSQ